MGTLGWDTTGYKGLMFRDIPGAKTPLIVRGFHVERTWDMSNPHRLGLFELTGPGGYVSLSDVFFREDEDFSPARFGDCAMIHKEELTVEGAWGAKLWDNSGTGSNDIGSAWKVDVGATEEIMVVPDGKGAACLFKSFRNSQDTPFGRPRILDLSQCKLLKNRFL